jgi:hypothetical protein
MSVSRWKSGPGSLRGGVSHSDSGENCAIDRKRLRNYTVDERQDKHQRAWMNTLLLDPLCLLVLAVLVQDQRGHPAFVIGLEGDLRIHDLQKVVSCALWKTLRTSVGQSLVRKVDWSTMGAERESLGCSQPKVNRSIGVCLAHGVKARSGS